jgi:hypothetical protein
VPDPRLREVALVAEELEPLAEQLQGNLGLDNPSHAPGVGASG